MGKATSLQKLECWNDCVALATGMIEFMGENDFRPWYIRGACHFALKQYEPAVNDLEKVGNRSSPVYLEMAAPIPSV